MSDEITSLEQNICKMKSNYTEQCKAANRSSTLKDGRRRTHDILVIEPLNSLSTTMYILHSQKSKIIRQSRESLFSGLWTRRSPPKAVPFQTRPVTSWNGLVEISCPAPATPMMILSPHPLWQASRAALWNYSMLICQDLVNSHITQKQLKKISVVHYSVSFQATIIYSNFMRVSILFFTKK